MEEAVRRRFEKIEAILQDVAERQAAAEVREQARANRADARMDRAEDRMDRAEERMDRMEARTEQMDARFEKRMRGFEKLVKIGMRELADLRRFNRQLGERLDRYAKNTDHKINALVDSQQRTEASLRAFLDSRKGRNGRNN
jgi:division protein CdvB (Snf7/Vps24/ESCRT-III family)